MKYFFLLLVLGLTFSLNAQTWTKLDHNRNQAGLEHNPLKGYATMWNVHTSDPEDPDYIPYSIQGKLFNFSDILTGYNSTTNEYIYDWSMVDNFVAEQGLLGKHVYLQVNIDPVENNVLHVPQFIMNELNTIDPVTGLSNLVYVNDTVLPNWNHPALMNSMVDLIEKFGERYNNDPRVFLVHMGLYGMWGEWHIFPYNFTYPHLEMTQANRDILANAFVTSFDNKQILARYPYSFSNPEDFGYSDGLYFENSIGEPFWYFQNILNDNGANENWKAHPIGGEVSPIIQDTLFHSFPNISGESIYFPDHNSYHSMQPANTTLQALHSSWLFAHYLFRNPNDTQLTQRERNNAERLSEYLGYMLYVKYFHTTATNGLLQLQLKIQNKGVAPIYENWDAEMAVIDENGTLITLKNQKLDLHTILPSSNAPTRTILANNALPDGNYNVVLRVINPLEQYTDKAPPLRFANRTQDMHLEGWLTVANITIDGGSVTESSQAIAAGPFGGKNHSIPGNIEGEAYDNGGLGVAFHDTDARVGNTKWEYRPYDAVDVVHKADASNGFAIGYTKEGEWLEYTVDVEETRNYELQFNYFCSAYNPGNLKVTIDGVEVATIGGIQSFSNWNTRGTITLNNLYLEEGSNKKMRLEFVNGAKFDIDNIVFKKEAHIPDGEYRIQSVSGAYLRASGLQAAVQSSFELSGDSTIWDFTHLGNDQYYIESIQFNNHRLEVPNGNCSPGLDVKTTWYTGLGDHLKWKASMVDGKLMFEPVHCLGNALDAKISNENSVIIDVKNPINDDQLFSLQAISTNMSILSQPEVENELTSQIVVYPNPTSDVINVRIPGNTMSSSTIELFDLKGRLLESFNTNKENTTINIQPVSSEAIVLVKVTNMNQSKVFRLMKK